MRKFTLGLLCIEEESLLLRIVLMLLAGTVAVLMLTLLVFFDPNAVDSIFPPCLFRTVTGFYCPGCGATRALHALLHGELAVAWSMNPLLIIALLIMPLLIAQELKPAVFIWGRSVRVIGDAKLWAICVVAFAVLRNVPVAPFSWLAPG